ncbi:lysoplasmalogenase [Actinoplanes sp. KI2]|uniref:lysoplasmalogenase n=1 Tax=Actinoplanes sp. KI2 TaxID=2983315 RepID=UPI0021D5A7FD|nr:lysoplasmalogenase [Actinoplanes sp. KI2]MCU7726307.1 lysoplasmalogenase [Actinoplanes sp. KI2]
MKLYLFVAAAVAELIAVAADLTPLQWVAKPLLAPLLIWYLARRDLVVLALCFATAGDIALLVPGAFLIGMVFFLGCQVCLTVAFLRRAKPTKPTIIAYAVVWAAANALLWPHLGTLRLPVLAYSLALTAMATAATAVSRRLAIGGALFVVSDLMIGMGAAGRHLPAHDVLVMATYSAALFLIATGWAATSRVPSPAPLPAAR